MKSLSLAILETLVISVLYLNNIRNGSSKPTAFTSKEIEAGLGAALAAPALH